MKKWGIVLLAALLLLPLGIGQVVAAPGTTSEVPVVLWHAYEEKLSMGNNGMVKAKIEEKADATVYTVYTKKMEFMSMTGGLTNLFIYENGKGSAKTEATQIADGVFQFTKPGAPMGEVWVAVWVDAMDELAGGGPGSGEQDARLRFDLANAKVISEGTPTPQPVPVPASDEIHIKVNGKDVVSDVKPFIENGRTMVPVRFVSEALGLKVDWVQAEQKVIIEDQGMKASLVIGEKIMVRDGASLPLDQEAMNVEGRTFVPIRAIAELFHAQVDWDNATRMVLITR